MEAGIYFEVTAGVGCVVGQLLCIRPGQLRPQPEQPVPGTQAGLVARITRIDPLPEFEVVGETGVDCLRAGRRVDIGSRIAELEIILLEVVAELQRVLATGSE